MTIHRIVLCHSCHARIIFFDTKRGRVMPVDADTVLADDTRLDLSHMVSHFATCPNSERHRKPRQP